MRGSNSVNAVRPVASKDSLVRGLVERLRADLTGRSGVVVKSHRRLRDLATGSLRQVDLCIEETLGGEISRTLLECRGSSAADLASIEQVVVKAKDVGAVRACVVARGGFSASALAKARQHGVIAAEVEEAMEPAWVHWLLAGPAQALQRHCRVKSLQYRLIGAGNGRPKLLAHDLALDEPIFVDAAGDPRESIATLLRPIAESEGLWKKVSRTAPMPLSVGVDLRETRYLRLEQGPVAVGGLQVELEFIYAPRAVRLAWSECREVLQMLQRAQVARVLRKDGTGLEAIRESVTGKVVLRITSDDPGAVAILAGSDLLRGGIQAPAAPFGRMLAPAPVVADRWPFATMGFAGVDQQAHRHVQEKTQTCPIKTPGA